jgi:hypothetical protein
MPRPGLLIPRLLRILPLILLPSLCAAAPVSASAPKPPRYPLRVHILAADESHKTPKMSPSEAVACDAIESAASSTGFDSGATLNGLSIGGLSGDLCSLHPEMVTGRLLDLGDDDPVFSGEGRGDLVSPPSGTQGLSFHYDNCSRVRVHPGFQSLPARWKKPGQKLEVLIPSDAIPTNGHPLRPDRCTFTVTLHDYVYLLLRNGQMVQVSQEVYWKKPALRVFLSGNEQAMQKRPPVFTVPAYPNR